MADEDNSIFGPETARQTTKPETIREEDLTADEFYGVKKTNELRDKYKIAIRTDADLFYGEGALDKKGGPYSTVLKDGLNYLHDNLALSNDQLEESRLATSKLAWELNMSPEQTSMAHGIFARNLAKPPSDETKGEWRRESLQNMREQYGDDAEKYISDAKAHAKKVGISQMLDQTGTGNHPRIVAMLVEQVQQLKRR